MKAHIGVDRKTTLIHSVTATPANVSDAKDFILRPGRGYKGGKLLRRCRTRPDTTEDAPMTLTQLRYLVAIADHGFNISRAAVALRTSQPGVSRQIRVLEQQLGVTILARSRGRVSGLTPAGTRILAKARRIMNEIEELRAKHLVGDMIGTLAIATQHSYAVSIVPGAVTAMRTRFPQVSVTVQPAAGSLCVEMVRYGDVDIAITIEPPPGNSGLAGLFIATIPQVLIVPNGHPLLKKRPIVMEDLVSYPFVGPISSSSTDWGVRRVFNAYGLDMRLAISVANAGVIQSYVAAGAGIGIVPLSLPRVPGTRIVKIEHLFKPYRVTAILDPHRQLPPYLYEFISKLAPHWTKSEIDRAMREAVSAATPTTRSLENSNALGR